MLLIYFAKILPLIKSFWPGLEIWDRGSETNRTVVICLFYEKMFEGGIFRHKHLIGTYSDDTRYRKCMKIVEEEIKNYVEGKGS